MHLAHVAGLDDEPDLHAGLLADEVVVHGGEHQERRDRREIGVRVAVGEHEELRAVGDRGVGLFAHLPQPGRERFGTLVDPVEAPDDARPLRAELALAPRNEVLDLRELVVVDHREVENDLPGVIGRRGQQVALRPEAEFHARHDFFTDAVERRVRHLRERLREVVEKQPRTFAQHRDRGVGAHRAERFGARRRHRGQQDAHFLLGVTEGALATHDRGWSVRDVLALGKLGELDAAGVEPVLPRLGRREFRLDFIVFDDASRDRVDQEHLAGTQPAFAHDAVGREVENADLAREHDETVVGDQEASGAKPVAVESRADERAVGEDQRGRAVPRFHEHRVELVERATGRIDVGLVLPGFRHHHHHRVRQRTTAEVQQLHDLVERRRVAGPRADDREQRFEVAEQFALELLWRARIQLRLP